MILDKQLLRILRNLTAPRWNFSGALFRILPLGIWLFGILLFSIILFKIYLFEIWLSQVWNLYNSENCSWDFSFLGLGSLKLSFQKFGRIWLHRIQCLEILIVPWENLTLFIFNNCLSHYIFGYFLCLYCHYSQNIVNHFSTQPIYFA